MTTTSNIFRPVSSRNRCLVCNSSTGCLIASEASTTAVICSHTESRKRCGTLGHLHLVVDKGPIWAPARQKIFKAARVLGEMNEEKFNSIPGNTINDSAGEDSEK